MGAGAEKRWRQLLEREGEERERERVNTNVAKAQWWRDLMNQGHILTFRACCGKIITAGRYQVATGYCSGFALLGLPNAKEYHDNAWGIALRIVEHCGRVMPVMIDGETTK